VSEHLKVCEKTLLLFFIMSAVEKSTSEDDPTIEKAYHNIQEGISAAFGMKGPGGLKNHFKKSISLHGFGSDVESSENSRVIV
jgi:hypothetical protein